MNDWGLPEINMCDFGFIYLLNSFCTFCEYFSFSINRPNFDLCSWVSRVPAFPRVDKQHSVWCTVHTLYSAMKCSPMQNVIMGNSHSLNHGSKPSILQWSEYYTFDRGTISSFELPLSKKKKRNMLRFLSHDHCLQNNFQTLLGISAIWVHVAALAPDKVDKNLPPFISCIWLPCCVITCISPNCTCLVRNRNALNTTN